MRFNWDYMVTEIDPRHEGVLSIEELISPQHGNARYGNFVFERAVYAQNLAQSLNDVCVNSVKTQCSNNVTVVLQTGTWDIAYGSIQQTLLNKDAGAALVEVIKSMAVSKCSKCINIVFMDAPPYPICHLKEEILSVPEVEKCIQQREGRNNYNLAAMNSFFEEEIKKVNYPRLEFLRSFEIVHPRLLSVHYLCKNHYLCRYGPKLFKSDEGILVVEAIKRSVCNYELRQ